MSALQPVDLAARRRLLREDPRLWRRWLVAQTRGLEPARCEAAMSAARPDRNERGWRKRGWSQLLIEERVAAGQSSTTEDWASVIEWARAYDDEMPLP